jgi:hypothetical protein
LLSSLLRGNGFFPAFPFSGDRQVGAKEGRRGREGKLLPVGKELR